MRTLFICDNYIEYQEVRFRGLTRRVKTLGKLEGVKEQKVMLPEGAVVNGQIFDTGELRLALDSLNIKGKSVSVLLDMNTLAIREFKIPSKGKGGIAHSIYANMQDVLDEGLSSYLFSYLENKKEKSGTHYTVTVMQKAKYDSCVDIITQAGIKVSHFEIANLAVVSTLSQVFAEETKQLTEINGDWKEGFVLLYQRDNILNMFMFENGKNTYLSRTKLFQSKDGTYTDELMNTITNTMKMHRDMIKYPVYTLGVAGGTDLDSILSLGLRVESIGNGASVEDNYFYTVLSGLSKTRYKFDFKESFEDTQDKLITRNRILIASFVLAALCGAGISTAHLYKLRTGVERDLDSLVAEKASLEIDKDVLLYREALLEIGKIDKSLANVGGYISDYNLDGVKNELQSFQVSKIKEIEDAFVGRVYITDISYMLQDGLYVDIQGEAVGTQVPAEYAESLRKSGVFSSVHLIRKGYTNDAYYTFTINCSGLGDGVGAKEVAINYEPFVAEYEEAVLEVEDSLKDLGTVEEAPVAESVAVTGEEEVVIVNE